MCRTSYSFCFFFPNDKHSVSINLQAIKKKSFSKQFYCIFAWHYCMCGNFFVLMKNTRERIAMCARSIALQLKSTFSPYTFTKRSHSVTSPIVHRNKSLLKIHAKSGHIICGVQIRFFRCPRFFFLLGLCKNKNGFHDDILSFAIIKSISVIPAAFFLLSNPHQNYYKSIEILVVCLCFSFLIAFSHSR